MGRTLKVGTRGSTLATTQAGHVRDALIAAGHRAELVIVQTKGDVVMAPVERIGVGVFTLELRAALERGDCDIAVHSYKDLPTARDERFAPIAVPPRVDPSDVLIARDGLTMETLPEGARVGTSAPRRRSQLAALRPDLDLHPLRGNIDTRMGYVTSGDLDAVVLAAAGLDRTRVGARAAHRFGIDEMLPAPAQGALAVEARVDDSEAIDALVVVDHLPTRVRIAAERLLLADLEAGCTAPVVARAELTGVVPADSAFAGTDPAADTVAADAELTLHAVVAAHDGSTVLRTTGTTVPAAHPDGPLAAAEELGRKLAAELLERGARDLMSEESPDTRDPLVPRESTTAPPTVRDS